MTIRNMWDSLNCQAATASTRNNWSWPGARLRRVSCTCGGRTRTPEAAGSGLTHRLAMLNLWFREAAQAASPHWRNATNGKR
jgi:hypothetical protein